MKSASNPGFSSWRWIRGAIFVITALVTLIALFYVIENWRGYRAWDKYKRELAARGERLNLSDYSAAPVPPEQNFAETPVLKALVYKDRMDSALWAKFEAVQVNSFSPLGSRMVRGDEAKEVLEAFKEVEPELAELRAAAKRPFAQFTNSNANPMLSDTPNLIVVRRLSQLLTIHASAALASSNSALALADLEVIRRLADALGQRATLVMAMFRVAVLGLEFQPLSEGLSAGVWSDQELIALQKYFESIDLLTSFDAAVRGGERNAVTRLVEDLPRKQLTEALAPNSKDWSDWLLRLAVRWCPRGWLYQNAISYSRTMQKFFEGYNVRQQRIFPEKCAEANAFLQEELQGFTPFNYLAGIGVPNMTRAAQATARQQVFLREATLVCALERYRRAHGDYPETLSALAPHFIQMLPTDLLTGEPLKYQRLADGTFQLYSIGWNIKDDGGMKGADKYRHEGDWVWPPPK